MVAYRYLTFPRGVAPTGDELAQFHDLAQRFGLRLAHGVDRERRGLAIVTEAEPFDHAVGVEPALADLLLKWRVRGAEVREHLKFARDSEAWKQLEHEGDKRIAPTRPQRLEGESSPNVVTSRRSVPTPRQQLAAKQISARESLGRANHDLERTKAAVERLERAARLAPYALWAIGVAGIVATGVYVGSRLLGSDRERRADTVERLAIGEESRDASTADASRPE
jgi:hypothetical protein